MLDQLGKQKFVGRSESCEFGGGICKERRRLKATPSAELAPFLPGPVSIGGDRQT
jgi:hypothetical protein